MSESDSVLVARILKGDERAADALLRRHFRSSYLVAFARARNTQDAEDICQEAFIKALDMLHTCRAPERVGAWLVQIVRNTAHNYMDHVRVRETESLGDHLDVVARERADASLERGELRATLLHALAQLIPVQAEAVLLHDLEGLRHTEIAERIGISAGMSRRHVSDARKRLRNLLESYPSLEQTHD